MGRSRLAPWSDGSARPHRGRLGYLLEVPTVASAHTPLPRVSPLAKVLTAVLAAILLFTVSSAAFPSDVLGATTLSTRCDGVSVRTRPSTSSTRKAVLPSGVQVNAVKKVTGSSWRVTCAGRTSTGNTLVPHQ